MTAPARVKTDDLTKVLVGIDRAGLTDKARVAILPDRTIEITFGGAEQQLPPPVNPLDRLFGPE